MSQANESRANAIRGVVYASVVAGSLFVIARLLDQRFHLAYQVLALISAALSFILLRRSELLSPWLTGRKGSIGSRICRVWTRIVGILLFIGYFSTAAESFARPVLLIWFVSVPLVLLALHLAAVGIAARFLPRAMRQRTAVIVFVNQSARDLAKNLRDSNAFELVGFFDDRETRDISASVDLISYLGNLRSVSQYVKDHHIDAVFVALPDDAGHRALSVVDDLDGTTASVYYVANFLISNLFETQVREIEGIAMLEAFNTPFYGADGALKRCFDFGFSLIALLALAPLLLLIALVIKLSSRGPVMDAQRRYDLNGRRFWGYKFRSVVEPEASLDSEAQPGSRNCPRVTSIGHLLRRTSMDELPKLINVLKGEMSVVGPRPHTVAHNEHYSKALKQCVLSRKVRPGLTGLAQVKGLRGETAQLERMDERIRFDLDYIKHWSPMLDVKIILLSLVMLFRDNKTF